MGWVLAAIAGDSTLHSLKPERQAAPLITSLNALLPGTQANRGSIAWIPRLLGQTDDEPIWSGWVTHIARFSLNLLFMP